MLTRREEDASAKKPLGFKPTKREIENRRHACMIIGAINVDALQDNGLQVVRREDLLLLYHADQLEAAGMDVDGALRSFRADP